MAKIQPFQAIEPAVNDSANLLYIGTLGARKAYVDRVLHEKNVKPETLRKAVATTQKMFPDSPHLLDYKRDAVADLLGGDENTADNFMLLEAIRINAELLANMLYARRVMRQDIIARALPEQVKQTSRQIDDMTQYLSGYVQALSGSGEQVAGIAMRGFIGAVEHALDKQGPGR